MTHRFHFTIKQRLQIMEQIEENKESLNDHNLSRGQLREWNSKRDMMEVLPDDIQAAKYILHPGPHQKYSDLYTFLYQKVKQMRMKKIAINHHSLIEIAVKEEERLKNLTESGRRSIINR